jgi:hypothetical protein
MPIAETSIVSRKANERKNWMDKIESLNHTKWDCKYHVVFIPKNRQKCCMGDCVGIWEMYFGVWHSTRRVE